MKTYFFTLALATSLIASSQNDVLVFMNDAGIHLRWKGYREGSFGGYHVYRRETTTAEWQRLTEQPQVMLTDAKAINELLGYRAELYFSLFGKAVNENISSADFLKWKNKNEHSFFEAMCVVNPEFGKALGEIFTDRTAQKGKQYEYKITVMRPAEKDWTTTGLLKAFAPEKIPLPQELKAEASDKNISLQWKKNEALLKSAQVVSYAIYRSEKADGVFLRQNLYNSLPVTVSINDAKPANTESWLDTFVEKGKTYYYRVAAVNAFGFESAQCTAVSASLKTSSLEILPADVSAQKLGASVQVKWKGVKNENVRYRVFTCATREGRYQIAHELNAITNDYSWLDTDALDGSDYFCFVRGIHPKENLAVNSDTLHVFFSDTHRPAAPAGVKAESLEGAIRISWSASKNPDLQGYEIEEQGPAGTNSNFLLTKSLLTQTVFVDSLTAADEGTHIYMVYAVDGQGNRSLPSAPVSARAIDRTAPVAPALNSLEEKDGKVKLMWEQFPTSDLHHFDVMMKRENGVFAKATETKTPSAEISMSENGRYVFAVQAVDASGNASALSDSLWLSFTKSEKLSPPQNGSAKADGRAVVLTWTVKPDKNLSGLFIVRTNLKTGERKDIGEFQPTQNSFTDLYTSPGTAYRYELKSYNAQFEMSAPLVVEFVPDAK